MTLVVPIIAAMVIGFMAGLFSFRVKSKWCRVCGSTLSCPECAHRHATPQVRV